MACHIAYATFANTASISCLEETQNYPKDTPEFKGVAVTLRQSNHTHISLEAAATMRVSHIRYAKIGGETRDKDRVFVELAYERYLKPRPDVASSKYDSLHRAFIDKAMDVYSHT
jgi:hypothetical protein